MASYSWKGLRGSFSYTAGNPLSTSTSYQVGGNFGNAGRFWEQPLGRFDAGHQPSDVFHFTVLSPSLAFTHDVIEARAAAQFFSANTDTTSTVDPRISGYNLRAGVAGKIRGTLGIPFMVKPFVNVARVTNRAKNNDSSHSNELLSNPYTALTISGGIDLMLWERSGIGFSYVRTMDRSPQYLPGGSEVFEDTAQDYLNIGVTYWITDETAVGARFARWTKLQTSRTSEQTLWSDQSFFLSLRVHL
jgi:hypothetical protein